MANQNIDAKTKKLVKKAVKKKTDEINRVRKRAGMGPLPTKPKGSGSGRKGK